MCPGEVIQHYGRINSTTTITPTQNGFLVGKSVVFSNSSTGVYGGTAIFDDNGTMLAGIPWAELGKGRGNGNIQSVCMVPVLKGVTYEVWVSDDGYWEWLDLFAPRG